MEEGSVVVVAVDGSKEMTDYALEWAIRNVIKSMDSLILLALLPSSPRLPTRTSTNKFVGLMKKWGFVHKEEAPCDGIDKAVGHDAVSRRIYYVCTQMMQRLCVAHFVEKVHTEVKLVKDAHMESVAIRAAEVAATWVILDRQLKKESDYCLKQYQHCNIVLIDHMIPKYLRSVTSIARQKHENNEARNDLNSSDPDDSIYLTSEKSQTTRTSGLTLNLDSAYFDEKVDTRPEVSIPRRSSVSSLEANGKGSRFSKTQGETDMRTSNSIIRTVPGRRSTGSHHLYPRPDSINQSNQTTTKQQNREVLHPLSSPTITRTSSIRKAISISMKPQPTPPPLCSICKHNAPAFGKGPRKFSYEEIEVATSSFSSDNLLEEGGYGFVYKGVLLDGQVIAVKQNKILSAQGAAEFCSEVEVLSCAQHRNLVMLVGYCIEKEWLLVYEFACNGSLDKHLFGSKEKGLMDWTSRMKVAMGAARGLRYLHEDCRVGCIIHRDFRPNNILLTHDFEPMVGDFGLARWQADGQSAEETRVIGAFGYLAPEYTQTGLITEKVDVYAFGVVLLELLCGVKGTDFSRNKDKQFVVEWGLPLLTKNMINELVDPRLEKNYVKEEVERLMYAASICLLPHQEQRPRMSKVLRIMEGDFGTGMASPYAQCSTAYPSRYMNNIYGLESPMITAPAHSATRSTQA